MYMCMYTSSDSQAVSCCCVALASASPLPFRSRSPSRLQALCDLEANSNDLKAELRELYIVSAKEVDVTGRKAVVIFVPFKLLKVVHKIQSRLVRELEKKFSGKHVVLIGQRRIMRKPSAGQRRGLARVVLRANGAGSCPWPARARLLLASWHAALRSSILIQRTRMPRQAAPARGQLASI